MANFGANLKMAAEGTNYSYAPTAEETEWQLQGECRDAPDVDFHTVIAREIRDIKTRYCSVCPVIVQCRAWALSRHEESGIWGGYSQAEREAIWEGRELKRHYRVRSA